MSHGQYHFSCFLHLQLRLAAEADAAADAARRGNRGAGQQRGEAGNDAGAANTHLPSSPVVTIGDITFSLDPAVPSPSFTFLPPAAMASGKLAEAVAVCAYVLILYCQSCIHTPVRVCMHMYWVPS